MLVMSEGDTMQVEVTGTDRVRLAARPSIAAEVEAWLLTQPLPDRAVRWRPTGGSWVDVPSVAALADRLVELTEPGDWGVAQRSEMWAQSMRGDHGWIVEVNGVPGPDGYARRVVRAGRPSAGFQATLAIRPPGGGVGGSRYFPSELVPSAGEVARLVWSWLHGGLTEGYELRDLGDHD